MDYRKIYISGKISGIRMEWARQNFDFACKTVKRFYGATEVVNPLDIKPFLGIKRWLFHMISDIWEQRKCTHSAFQVNWKDSMGAVIEYFFAKFIFKQGIIFLE